MKTLQKIALVLTIIGALNWGLVGLFDFNLVTAIFGAASVFTRIVYVLIAVCGLVNILLLFMNIEERSVMEHHETKHVNTDNRRVTY